MPAFIYHFDWDLQVYSSELSESDEFLCIASDGLWDILGPSQVASIVSQEMLAHGDIQKAAEKLVRQVDIRRGEDNTGVILVKLQ